MKKGAGKWSEISKFVRHRTDNQCWRRWKFLNADSLPHYRLTIMKRRKSLVNNFVGREKEHSNLTPEDFEISDELIEEPKVKNRKLNTSLAGIITTKKGNWRLS